jgi:nitroreductase
MKLTSDEVEIPASAVGVYDAIFRRRNVKEFTADPVSRETLERLFAAAIWAPNHRMTEPTRFFAIPEDSPMRTRIAEAAWQSAYDEAANPNPEQKRRSADGKRDRVLHAPAMVYVYSLDGENDEITRENYATACCAVQNMALAAVAEGLCMDWSTGGLTRIPGLAAMLGADEAWTMVGVVCLGKAAALPTAERTPHSEVVTWLE